MPGYWMYVFMKDGSIERQEVWDEVDEEVDEARWGIEGRLSELLWPSTGEEGGAGVSGGGTRLLSYGSSQCRRQCRRLSVIAEWRY